tara:strand:+ start:5041 stop:7443 length:2403 start_codon:yes stop_codon:yes gene_type:complete
MKNNLLIIIISLFICGNACSENIQIQSKNISLDKDKETTVFEKEVVVKTKENITIKSDYAEYRKKDGYLKLKGNILAVDENNNSVETNHAEYFENKKILKSKGETKITTSENYMVLTENVTVNNTNNTIFSENQTSIKDEDNNKIFLDNFKYNTIENIFKSIGQIKIEDNLGNKSEFSQIYIDTKKKEILGTDIKAYLNDESFKVNKKNKPRIFSNTMKINNDLKSFNKSKFTLCDYRENDKCPPWTIQASEMLHDNKKKTIYYKNAVIKVYDIPIFYLPKLSHPDPTVDRRSGFLPPSFSDTKNLGSGLTVPYFLALDKDKDFTFTNKIYVNENPLFLTEYRQAFKNSNLIVDTGYTEGYKNTSSSKKSGEKSHFFLEFVKNFKSKNGADNNLIFKSQNVTNDKYFKLYKIDSSIADYKDLDTLENSLSFTHENEDLFFGFNASIYETLKDSPNDKYEYILPEFTLGKNIFNNSLLGNLDFQSNLKVHNYDTNKTTKFLINDFDWDIKEFNFSSGINSKLLAKIKNVNYEAKNDDNLKGEPTSELYGAMGYLSEINFFKQQANQSKHYLTPKMLLRYAPGKMRNEESGPKMKSESIFSLERLNAENNFESGLSATLGFDYEISGLDSIFNLSAGQIFKDRNNDNMPDNTSLDKKASDFVGYSSLKLKNNFELNYDFAVDESFKNLNYSEIGSKIDLDFIKFDLRYLQEKEHIGHQEYFSSKFEIGENNTKFSFENKRNLITDSSEFYNLSYEYLNDCLRAGLVYRREFYNDAELEPENSLMFKITLIPFGNLNTPAMNQ